MTQAITHEQQDLVKLWPIRNMDKQTKLAIRKLALERGLTISETLKHLVSTYNRVADLVDKEGI